METMKVAFLVYSAWSESRRNNSSFDGLSNIGAYMLIDVLKRKNIDIEFCSVDTAKEYDIILVSFCSIYDVLAYYKAVALHKDFKSNRKFKILGGGFGLQNITPLKDFLDYAWFGRCENNIYDLLVNNLEYEHPSFMNLKHIKKCYVNQCENTYQYSVILNTSASTKHNEYKESRIGCPNKCFFCHYTYSRKSNYKHNEKYNTSLYQGSQEIDMFNYKSINLNTAKLTVGLDGMSERLRYIVNKRISNELLKEAIIYISNNTTVNGAVFLQIYNITNYETETIEDFNEFINTIESIKDKLKTRVILVLHNTPLHASPLTPIAYTKITFGSKLNNDLSGKLLIKEHPKLHCICSLFQESDWRCFESLSVERCTDKNFDIFKNVVFNKKLSSKTSAYKLKSMLNSFDCSSLIREYDIKENLPTWYLESYIPQSTIGKMREVMKNNQLNFK